jgi:type IV pilus assembly protein PilC
MESTREKLSAFSTIKMIAFLIGAVGSVFELVINGYSQSDSATYVATGLFIFCFLGLIDMPMRLFWVAPADTRYSSLRSMVLIVFSIIFWSVTVGICLIFIAFIVSLLEPAAGPIIVYALAFVVIILVAVNTAAQIVRRRRMLLILSNLEKASQLNLPMTRMVLAAAGGETGMLRMRLMSLHDRLDRGEPLDQALLHSVPEISRHVIRAIDAGQRMNCLPHVLTHLIRRRTEQTGPFAQTFGLYRAYPVIFFAVLLVILVFVIPKFQGIFHDFKLDLPQPTRFLIYSASNGEISWVLLALIALIPIAQSIQSMFPSFRKISPFGGAVADQIIWWMPVAGSYVRDRGMADLCDLTAVGVEMGHPLDQTLRNTAAAQPSAVMRNRTAAWADAVAHGQPIHEAARSAHFPDLFVAMLATVRDSTGLLQVLEFLWRHYEYRFVRTRTLFQAAYVPIIVFLMGAMVALLGVSLLKPLALLSEHIATHISGGF